MHLLFQMSVTSLKHITKKIIYILIEKLNFIDFPNNSASSNVCGIGLPIVSGRKNDAIPADIASKPIIINGKIRK